MQKSLFTLAVISTALFSSAAYAGETYVGASAGVNLQQESKNKGTITSTVPASVAFPAIPAGADLAWDTKFKEGLDLNLVAGHRFDAGLRVELQGYYNRAGVDLHRNLAVGGTVIDGVDSAVLTRGAASPTNPTVGAVLSTDAGKIKNYGVFANAFYDIKASENFMPYVGVGIGYQKSDVKFIPSGVPVIDDSDGSLAYQAMAGVTYKIGPSIELFGQYTYRMADRAKVDVTLLPATLGIKSKQSLINVGFRIPFGGGQ